MQRRADLVRATEDRFIATSPLCHDQALALYESMLDEARRLGVFPPEDPWEGLEVDLRLAQWLARCSPSS